jgi:hypothetical protein
VTEDDRKPGEAPKPGTRYSTYVGVAFLVLIVIAVASAIRRDDQGILGASEARLGTPLAEFAVPELLGSLEGDANIFQDDCESSEIPCPVDDRRTPACEVDLSEVIRVCDLFDRPLAISFWFTRGAECLPTQDAFDRVARRYRGRVNFLSINVRDDRDDAARIVRERGWRLPVGYDADGAVSSLYRVGVCPTVALAYPGGILAAAKIGSDDLSGRQMVAEVETLVRESRRRAATSR